MVQQSKSARHSRPRVSSASRTKVARRSIPFFSLPLQEQVNRARPHVHHIISGTIEGGVASDLESVVDEIAGTNAPGDEHRVAN
jgi:hypothetical protein